MDKVSPAHGKKAAHERVAHHHDGTENETRGVIHTKDGAEEFCASDKARDRIEKEEGQNENRGDDADDALVIAETVREKVRESNRVAAEMAVLAESATDDFPVEVRTDHKADTDPSFGKTAHEHGARKAHQHPAAHVGRLGGHGDHPLVHAAVTEVIGVQAVRLAREICSDAKHHQQIKDKDDNRHKTSVRVFIKIKNILL